MNGRGNLRRRQWEMFERPWGLITA